MRLDQAVELWVNQQTPQTAKTYAKYANKLMEYIAPGIALAEITPLDMNRYLNGIKGYTFTSPDGEEKHYAIKTMSNHVKHIKIFFSWCVKDADLLDKSPARLLKVPTVPLTDTRSKAMSDRDLETLLTYTQNKLREHAIIHFAADTACRIGALSNLRIRDLSIDEPLVLDDGSSVYTAKVRLKGGNYANVGFSPKAARALREWLVRRPACDHDYVFVTQRRKKMSTDYIGTVLRRLAKDIERDWNYKLTHYNIHSLRHRMGHKMFDDRVNPALVQRKLNHASIETTLKHYAPTDYESA
ncbi:MAG: site-specific integrase, partial [Chloroflexota bacterium]